MNMDVTDLPEPTDNLQILHVFADYGVESAALSQYGDVLRVTINPRENNYSEVIQADAREMPLSDDRQFDLGVFHPPCTKWCDMPSADTDAAPNLIPLSREIADDYCDEYIIENKPRAPLKNPTKLTGKMFGLPIEYERAFETSFDVDNIPEKQDIETEISPYFYSDRSKAWWCAIKNVPNEFPKQHVAKNSLPSAYVNFLMRKFLESHNRRDADRSRSTHSDPEPYRLQ